VVSRNLLHEDNGLPPPSAADRRDTVFLLLWLGLEVLGYFVLSPFAAVRRFLVIVVLLTLLAGRLAAQTCLTPARRRTTWAITAGGVVLGLAFYFLDLREAWVQKQAAEEAAAWVRDHGGGRVWYLGHWGFQFAAEHCGMLPVIARYAPEEGLPPPSHLHEGDWLVVPGKRIHRQDVELSGLPLELAVTLTFEDPVPLRTVWCFYLGRTPVERHTGPRLQVDVYRVGADCTPLLAP
jgi:hypothetical protein